ncbi:deoxyguanosinetriphosphate triphosphohydrolase family protein [Telmatobacter bradus]|uniref:deoxyguanosinetriphosphate triphosphohydrolase family protein n=1 Tax=Telmatobacter bradus TaxID=474953 RepID=UPI003B429657
MQEQITKLAAEIAVSAEPTSELARRTHPEPTHAYRSPFSRDAARILHARAFRRLAGKTQVFTRLPGDWPADHFRSRLTHTLEVAQIARTLARALGLNSDLTEALALSHDIGHPPFGHAGEKALDKALRAHGLHFDHNLHALRIVTWFEERYPAFRGLNLTLGLREGIVKHSHDYTAAAHPELGEYLLDQFPPLEAQLIDLADEIAYLTADLDDGLTSGILQINEVRSACPLFAEYFDQACKDYPEAAEKLAISDALRHLLDLLATDLMMETRRRVLDAGIIDLKGVRRAPQRLAALSSQMEAVRAETKKFLYARLYGSDNMEADHAMAAQIVEELFQVLINNPKLLPEDHQTQIPAEGLARTVADYIAGMTDAFIYELWARCR